MRRTLPLLLLAACAPDLALIHAWDDGADARDTSDTDPPPPKVISTENGDGSVTTVVDARAASTWVALDFDQGAQHVDEGDPGWDLKAMRYDIASNGGVSGDGGVEVLFLADVPLDQASVPADAEWMVDQPDGDDGNQNPDYAFMTWFDYDGSTHLLSPFPGTWLVRTTEGSVVALRIDSYYAPSTGDSGVFSLTWRVLDSL